MNNSGNGKGNSNPEDWQLVERLNSLRQLFAEAKYPTLVEQGKELLLKYPNNLLLKRMVAVSMHRAKDYHASLKMFKEILAVEGNDSVALHFSALNYLNLNQPGQGIAFAQKAIEIDRNNAEIWNTLSSIYLLAEQWNKAISAAKKSLAVNVNYFPALANLGEAMFRNGKHVEAKVELEKCLAISSQNLQAIALLAKIAIIEGNSIESQRYISKGTEGVSSKPEWLLYFSGLLNKFSFLKESVACLEQALKVAPKNVKVMERLANGYRFLGRFEDCTKLLSEAMSLNSDSTSLLFNFAYSKKLGAEDSFLIDKLHEAAPKRSGDNNGLALVHYAMGKYFDDVKDFKSAAESFNLANQALQKTVEGVDIQSDRYRANVDFSIQYLNTELFEKHQSIGSQSCLPIFILGMERSGTTLVEQILSSHPAVSAGGEQDFLLKRMPYIFDSAGHLSVSEAIMARDEYLSLLSTIAGSQTRITDKMPSNYLILGLIGMLFPRAKVIHCIRNPGDNCVSIYTTPSAAIHYTHSRSHVVEVYRDYIRLMGHWRKILPQSFIFDAHYEGLISDPEVVTRKLIDFCDLDWDDRCLDYCKNGNAVLTPSTWQVRQPIYTSSMSRATYYAEWFPEFVNLNDEILGNERVNE